MDEAALLAAQYETGEKAKEFIESDTGQYVVKSALQEIDGLRQDLEIEQEIDKIRELQREIAARKHSLRWIKEAIDRGYNAGTLLQSMNTED